MSSHGKIEFRKSKKFGMDHMDYSPNLWRGYCVCNKYKNVVTARFGSIGYAMGNY